jgi:hypothetical protein
VFIKRCSFYAKYEIQINSCFSLQVFANRLPKVYKEPCGRFYKQENQNGFFQKKLSIAPARGV